MSALITNIIPRDNFELVRDRIGEILKVELENQKVLQNFDEVIEVYQERIKPIATDENLFINVLLDSATYGEYTAKDQQGRTIFFIDINTTGKADTDTKVPGDVDSSQRLHRFMRMCRYILSSSLYQTLGFPYGVIGGRYIESFATFEPVHKEDGNYTRMGRISFAVRIQESQAMATPVPLAGNDTTVKLELTTHGYKYVFENAA